jgi:predicted O-methyltransferase YrrM
MPYTIHNVIATTAKVDAWYNATVKRMKYCNAVIMKMASMDAVKKFQNGELDFVYIDANHDYEYAIQDITEWSKKVRVGGMVSGHDYDPTWGVKKAVDEYVTENNIECFYSDDWSPSFWWVKK